MSKPSILVSTEWLDDNISDDAVKIFDASWRLPNDGDAFDDYRLRHIKRAVFFDIDEVADPNSNLPHMYPPPSVFQAAVRNAGIKNEDFVVIYDDKGITSGPRVWWTFHCMGHRNVAVLDGGLPKWLKEGRDVTDHIPTPGPSQYKVLSNNSNLWSSAAEIRSAIRNDNSTIIDARPVQRFSGDVPEPRDGLRSGHMPGAINLPVNKLLKQNGTLQRPAALIDIFNTAGVDLNTDIITTCGSGIAAAVITLALQTIGHKRHRLYDGSWTEWGALTNADSEFPVETGR